MSTNPDPYFSRPEVSNSDLSWLKNQLHPRDMPDPTQAYRFGSLIDAMLTENHRVDYFKRSLDNDNFTPEEFEMAVRMKQAFLNDEFCRNIITGSEPQKISVSDLELNYSGLDFNLKARCKWDIWRGTWGGDIKSTTATTQAQFVEACKYFEYDRQRAWYMDIEKSDKDVLIGISKKNFKIFKVFIDRNHGFYKSGKEKYTYLAFKYWLMFGETKPEKNLIANLS